MTNEFANPENKIIQISLSDLTGKPLFETNTARNSFNYTGNKLMPGIYVVTVKGEDIFYVSKMVVK